MKEPKTLLMRKATCAALLFVAGGIALLSSSCATEHAAHAPHFAYSGDQGPGFWAQQSADWAACSSGIDQSPVDITGTVADPALAPLALTLHPTPIHLSNNGRTIEQEYEEGSSLTIGAETFELKQFHFHTLSEHTVGGRYFPMELHAVFKNPESGRLAVIGVLFEVGTSENAFLGRLLAAGLPEHAGATVIRADSIDLGQALTDPSAYYRYSGSLTTPPCSPIVTWTVLKTPATLTQKQADAFRRILGNNFRPIQGIGTRTISERL